ncbi:hypothetical protein BH11MYX1_BH11MYX1_35380 [soil metagenome]
MVTRALVIVCVVCSSVATAGAKKRPAQLGKAEAAAQKVAEQWIIAMHFGGGKPAATALTQTPFFSIAATDDNATPCAETPATTGGQLAAALACLHDHIAPKGTAKVWHRTLGGPLAAQTKHIAELAKGSIIFELDEGCDGTSNQTLVIVKGKQVSAVLAQTAACTE